MFLLWSRTKCQITEITVKSRSNENLTSCVLLVVYQRGLTSGAGASILQVKAEWTFAAERALCVHAPGAHGAGAAHTLIHVWTFKKIIIFKGPLLNSDTYIRMLNMTETV